LCESLGDKARKWVGEREREREESGEDDPRLLREKAIAKY
jgi:hypothetical protein